MAEIASCCETAPSLHEGLLGGLAITSRDPAFFSQGGSRFSESQAGRLVVQLDCADVQAR
jgi:hypothetical protein